MLPLFDRRKRRLADLQSVITNSHDRDLLAALAKADSDELAVAILVLPLMRLNIALANVAPATLSNAMARADAAQNSNAGVGIDERAATRLVERLRREHLSHFGAEELNDLSPAQAIATSGNLTTPLCIRALDFAGKVLGELAIVGPGGAGDPSGAPVASIPELDGLMSKD